MRDDNAARDGRPSLSWVPVVDERGRTRMEACWRTVTTSVAAAATPATAAHHAA